MRKAISKQSWPESINIGEIQLDTSSRDDMSAILTGLHAISMDKTTRTKLFRLLDKRILPDLRGFMDDRATELWRILVMGVLKHGLGWGSDHLQELVNENPDVRTLLGHDAWFDPRTYKLEDIQENVELLTPELLRSVGRLVAATKPVVAKTEPWLGVRQAR